MKKAIILSRGKSIEYVKTLNPKDYDLCVFVNDWTRELQIPYLANFLIESKQLHHYVCRENFAILHPHNYKALNVDMVRLNILKKEYFGMQPYHRASPIKSFLDENRIPSGYISEEILKWSAPRDSNELRLPGFPTMGVLSTVELATMYDFDEITVLGVDFYESEYMTVCSSNQQKHAPQKSGIGKAPIMKKFLTEFFPKKKDVQFKFYTYSSFDPECNHVEIINEKLEEQNTVSK